MGREQSCASCGPSVSSPSPVFFLPLCPALNAVRLALCSPVVSLLSVQIPPKSLSPTQTPSLNSSLQDLAATSLGHPTDSKFHISDAELLTRTLSTPAKGSSWIASISPDGSGCGCPPLPPQPSAHHRNISEPAPALLLGTGVCRCTRLQRGSLGPLLPSSTPHTASDSLKACLCFPVSDFPLYFQENSNS